VVEGSGHVTVCVHDDGVGFDPSQRADGFGLLGMRERVSLVSGYVDVQSTPGAGTTVRASLPSSRRDAPAVEERSRRPA
jgi:signal transduction histidine kinase